MEALLGYEVLQVSAGNSHVIVLTSDNEVFTWGRGDNGASIVLAPLFSFYVIFRHSLLFFSLILFPFFLFFLFLFFSISYFISFNLIFFRNFHLLFFFLF